MSIIMIGIDHNKAPVDVRALFSFTRKNAGEAMEHFRRREGVSGCVILSTCNRLEIWASLQDDKKVSLYEELCSLKGLADPEKVYEKQYFVARDGREAVEHLFYLTSGLKSQILGEDQILTQVKDALTLAREHFTTDNVLEVLFRMAATVGKRIKTEVPFSHGNPSVIHQAIDHLKAQEYSVAGKICMVIGNGEMGKVAAQTLEECGADVTVTVRQYRSGVVNIPRGCKRINYGERMSYLPFCDLVVSATASPNYTLREELFQELELTKPLILIDLAVPRDIETSLGSHPGITLYDMDSFRIAETPAELTGHLEKAGRLVQEQMAEFEDWYNGRDLIPRIQEIKAEAVQDFHVRIEKILRRTISEKEEQEKLQKAVDDAVGKVINKMIFGLKDSMEEAAFLKCIAGLEKLYED